MADYLSKTASLSLIEHGAYTLLLDYCYLNDGSIPGNMPDLYRVVRATTKAERGAVNKIVAMFFDREGEVYRNLRVTLEIEKAKPAIEAAKTNGVMGGRPRRNPVGFISKTKSEPNSNQGETQGESFSTTNHQPSTSNHQPPTKNISPGADATRRTPKPEPPTNAVWQSYADTYAMRYGTTPVRNAKVNGQLAQLVQRLGGEEAPAVAASYVQHNKSLYISANHCVDLLLRDCEGLRTQWANGRITTDTEARQMDRKQNHLGIAERLIAKQREKHGQ